MTTTSTSPSSSPAATTAPATPRAVTTPGTMTPGASAPGPAREAAPARPRIVAGPQRRPASYPEAARRPGVRRVRVGAPARRLPVEVDDAPDPRPIRSEPSAPLPDPTAQCCSVVRAAVEVLRDERPAAHLARWVTPQVRDQLAERARLLRARAGSGPATDGAPASRPVLVRRVRLVRLGEDVAEATVVLDDDGRVRAAAVRLEARRGIWRVAVLEIG